MGPIYGLPEFLVRFRYDNTGEQSWLVIEAADEDGAAGQLRRHAYPLPVTVLTVEPWMESDPLPAV